MTEQDGGYKVPHKTVGGKIGHICRRLIHVAMIILPILYYYIAEPLFADNINLEHKFLLGVLLLVLVTEAFRLWRGMAVFGQREHERKQISSFTWGFASIVIILLFSPDQQHHAIAYALPLIGGCAIGDPWVGELRTYKVNTVITVISGIAIVAGLWLLCSIIFHIPWWYALVAAPLAIVGEYIKLSWIDDNATMMLLPFVAVLALHHLI